MKREVSNFQTAMNLTTRLDPYSVFLRFPLRAPPRSLTSPRYGCPLFQPNNSNNGIVTARDTPGTSIKLGGDFALSLGGSRSQYLPSGASARDVKLALEAMDTVGTVDVVRSDGDGEVTQNRQAGQGCIVTLYSFASGPGLVYLLKGRDGPQFTFS